MASMAAEAFIHKSEQALMGLESEIYRATASQCETRQWLSKVKFAYADFTTDAFCNNHRQH